MSRTVQNIDFMIAGLRTVSEANQREHWRVRFNRKKAQQEEVTIAMQNVLRGRRIEVPCVVKLTRIGARALDSDNLAGSFKHIQDQVARIIGVDDGSSYIRFEYSQMPVGIRSYGVKIAISQP